ncbi:hypothetical protein F4778DRAFT_388536 [Xylariomycetidae sp. FL2044]|nr:hypothetical protein F4778DRAFT_388536 [Xylariomycetidae sp. FL2044]
MIWITAAIASLLAVHAEAASGVLHHSSRRAMEAMVDGGAANVLRARQDTGLNLTAWNTDTLSACMSALSALSAATNPSGTAICYNLPSLDTNNGTFMADLRLFQVSTPFGDFENVPPTDITVGLQYNGASVSLVNSEINARDLHVLGKRQNVSPTLLQTYMFVGQINQDQMVDPMTLGVVEPLVMPHVTLSGKAATGETVSTDVSSNEAAFVNGIFSKEVIMSDFARASLAVDEVTAELKNGTIAFIVPGVNILIFPVGLVVTSIWAFLGFAVYGFGTYERYMHRDNYRSRKARMMKPSAGRI